MEGRTVRVHYCFKQYLGEEFTDNCNCRKVITYSEAESLIRQGRADWVILSRTPIAVDEVEKFKKLERGRFSSPLEQRDSELKLQACPVCAKKQEAQKKLCNNCHGRGYQDPTIYWEELSRWQLPERGGQIVVTAQADDKGRFGKALQAKTPRVATIENKHIIRAVLDGRWEAQERIDDYNRVNRLELYGKPANGPLAEKEIKFEAPPEPEPELALDFTKNQCQHGYFLTKDTCSYCRADNDPEFYRYLLRLRALTESTNYFEPVESRYRYSILEDDYSEESRP